MAGTETQPSRLPYLIAPKQGAQSDSKATKDESHKFISKKEFDGLQEQIESLRADVDKIKRAKPKRIVETVEVEDDE